MWEEKTMIREKIGMFFKENKNMRTIYIILIIGTAVLICANSFFGTGKKNTAEGAADISRPESGVKEELEEILSMVKGAGHVKVMITYESTGEKYYASDVTSENNSGGASAADGRTQTRSKQSKKVITPSNSPVLTKEDFPKVMGVIVVCDGGGDVQVKSDIISAVKSVLDVADHKISVFAGK